jgi:hypothetical protein
MMETRKCTKCLNGVRVSAGFEFEGKKYPETRSKCSVCMGAGTMEAPDFPALFKAITTTRGAKTKGVCRFRQSAPEGWKQTTNGIANRRAYYVWRMARFHGGADVTMPVTAMTFCGDDAWREELDRYAAAVAVKVFGTHVAGVHRWGRALGHDIDIKGLPASAYEGGPVHDGNKPWFEREELK